VTIGTGSLGRGGVPPLEAAANTVIRDLQRVTYTPVGPPLTPAERQEAAKLVREGLTCQFCAGLHAGPSSPACPRLASGKLNGDGAVIEFTFWPDGQWDTSRVRFVADLADETEATETAEEA
jgi:hypothetical protein